MLNKLLNIFSKKPPQVPQNKRPVLINQNPPDAVMEYAPDFIDPCFCGSERYFKDCCGSREENRPPPYGVFIIPDFIDREDRLAIRDYADQQKGTPLMVIDEVNSTPDNIIKVVDDRRVSEYIDLGERFEIINKNVKKAFQELAPKYFNCEVEWYESPSLMRYSPGGYYHAHADSENLDLDTGCWKKVIDRDISLLLYFNDDYEGGELLFNKFNYHLRPKAGMAVIFPSDNRFMHTAEIVVEGVRYAAVSWASVKGVKKIASSKPENSIVMD